MHRVLVIDNYDSFTYNLVHLIEALTDGNVQVIKNDQVSKSDLLRFEHLVFSPGPGLPEESAQLLELVRESVKLDKRILGVCLGHQALAMTFGAKLKNLPVVHHGVSHRVRSIAGSRLFDGLSSDFTVGRYHSWVIDERDLSEEWMVSCRDEAGEVMGMEHQSKPFYGVQFHPESVLTPDGRTILENFLRL